jgi:subtilisin family serine protease
MKIKFISAFVLAAFVLAMIAAAQKRSDSLLRKAEVEPVKTEPYVPGELLVKIRGGAESRAAANANELVGATQLEQLGMPDWQRVKLPDGLTVDSAIAVYDTLADVEYAQPNFYYHLLSTPNDPSFTSTGMYGLGKISAPQAWDLSTGSYSVVVADIDTGLRYTHQDLAANAWVNTGEIPGNGVDDDGNGFVDDVNGWDFFYGDSNPIDDAGGHGTHTGGTIGAVGNNGLNVVGVNWNVKIMPIKIYSPNGTDSTSGMLVNSYAYIRMMKLRGVNIRATNNSYGDCGEACGYDQATKDGIDAMGDAGIVSVFAAGNDAQNVDSFPAGGTPSPGYPVRYTSPSIIGVASSTSSDAKSSFSNWGLTSIDLAAPGSSVLSTWNTSNTATNTISGTSMATPHVTGAVALLSAYRPDLSAASLKASILNNVDVLPAWATLVKTGGRLNIFKAMQNPTVCTFDTGGIDSIRLRGLRARDLTFSVTAAANCDYMVKSDSPWLTINGNNVFSSNGTVSFHVTANTTGVARTATISFGSRAMIVRQMPSATRD